MKKLIALTLATVMLFALCACTGNEDVHNGESVNNAPLTKDDVITMTTLSSGSWPYNENWIVWDYIEEGTGATLEINAVPDVDYKTKWSLMYASPDSLTDIVLFDVKRDSDKYANQGAFKSFEEMAPYMPNYKAFAESLTEEQYDKIVNVRKAYDGQIYYSPGTGRETTRSIRAWLYRKDIFDKHGLALPTTYDEVYEVSKKLKEIYPDSYPFAARGFTALDSAGSNWKEYWVAEAYYDYNAGKWCYGAAEDVALDMYTWYNKMLKEKLCTPDFLTINTQAWQEIMTTDRGFLMPDYLTRIDFFNPIAKENNPEFNLTAFAPPIANPETGKSQMTTYNYESVGFTISNTGDEKRMANAAKFVDWFYSDEAMELVSWGKEGETYTVENGEKVYILDDTGTQVSSLYGFTTHGTFTRVDPKAVESMETKDIAAVRDMVIEHSDPNYNPAKYLAFNDEEQKVVDETYSTCRTYAQEMMTKFILGQEPLSAFDAYVETINEMGVDRLLAAYESAYDRIK
ncbi:MAG: extracellular solute-binding protein [Oscillospiraceae bacterium]|nr:extracellular solute-binding protein [Oscillospiraceae bacterium]